MNVERSLCAVLSLTLSLPVWKAPALHSIGSAPHGDRINSEPTGECWAEALLFEMLHESGQLEHQASA